MSANPAAHSPAEPLKLTYTRNYCRPLELKVVARLENQCVSESWRLVAVALIVTAHGRRPIGHNQPSTAVVAKVAFLSRQSRELDQKDIKEVPALRCDARTLTCTGMDNLVRLSVAHHHHHHHHHHPYPSLTLVSVPQTFLAALAVQSSEATKD